MIEKPKLQRGNFMFGAFIFCTLIFGGFSAASHAQTASPEMLTNTCVACHGAGGVSQGPAIPSLAGLTRNYFVGTMLAYKYADDEEGLEAALDELYQDEAYEYAEAFPRYSTIMSRLAGGYTLEEIIVMADVFADQAVVPVAQNYAADEVALGEELHDEYCGNCHEEGGLSTADDVGLLAGQWLPYLEYTMEDYLADRREMPKKMRTKLKKMYEAHGGEGLHSLLQYYASVRN